MSDLGLLIINFLTFKLKKYCELLKKIRKLCLIAISEIGLWTFQQMYWKKWRICQRRNIILHSHTGIIINGVELLMLLCRIALSELPIQSTPQRTLNLPWAWKLFFFCLKCCLLMLCVKDKFAHNERKTN